jgi:hypothetical protein
MKEKIKILLLAFTFLIPFVGVTAFAQTSTVVRGIVTDAKEKDPLPYVTVLFKGTTISTRTDADGRFTISTAAGKRCCNLVM